MEPDPATRYSGAVPNDSSNLFANSLPSRVKVLLPLPLAGAFDYAILSPYTALLPGTFVSVPLGGRDVVGVVWDGEIDPSVNADKIKTISHVHEAPPLAEDVRRFVDWVARYTLNPKGVVLRMVMRSGAVISDVKPLSAVALAAAIPSELKMTDKRRAVLAAAEAGPTSVAELAVASGASPSIVRGLIKAGALRLLDIDPDPPFLPVDPARPGRRLSPDQQSAADALIETVTAGGFSTTLIDGVTGSGKTEVYLEAVAAALRQDPSAQACILLPEIALTLPFLKRLEDRFGAPVAHWHSDVGGKARRRVWRRVADGSARVVVGARSALFLPYSRLRMIVVDEEHEAAYKQHDGVLYQARDMAVARGALSKFPVVLVSATPSLETLANVNEGRYGFVKLASRFGPATLPDTDVIDMRQHSPERGEWLSPKAISAIKETLARQEQVLLYLNRRGYAPVTLCRKCGERLTAPHSDTWLVEHKYTNRLICHHTGFSMPKPDHCPHCGAHDSLAPCGPGVERIAEEAVAKWPDARVEVFSSDTMGSTEATKALLARMTAGEIDILVATQAAAKGHNFPHLTLVVAVDADLGLAGGDLRAAERTFQVLSQVAGRAGRAEKPGRVLLQSYQPGHPVITSLARYDRDGFAAVELEGRAALGFPPFGRLAAVILAGDNEAKLLETAQMLVGYVPHADGVEIWGPAPAPLYRLRGTFRVRFLVKTNRRVSIQSVLDTWLKTIKIPSSIRISVDVDPYNFS